MPISENSFITKLNLSPAKNAALLFFLDPCDQLRNTEPFILEVGDRILLCSDGLYNSISEKEISQLISGHPQNAADALIEAVIAQGIHNQDNVTVAILSCEPDIAIESHSAHQMTTTIRKKRHFAVIVIIIISILGAFIAYVYICNQFQIKSYINGDATNIETDSKFKSFSNVKVPDGEPSKTKTAKTD
ncbi:MAG: hypothetical protein PHO01_11170 [Desulfotomaculaceae bacterium]|nr:hypothetical protein [Desulfotomaculaceae bacterium]